MTRGAGRGGFRGVRNTAGPITAVTIGDAARAPGKHHVEQQLDVECWCHSNTVRVYAGQLALGRTSSCRFGCTPPPGYQEAERGCVDCGDRFTPASWSQRRCVPCNVQKHMG